MKTITGIKSNTKPEGIDYSDSSVYVRSNIKESVEVDPVFSVETNVYTYDEVEYTLAEWNKISTELLTKRIDNTNFALLEIVGILERILNTPDKETAIYPYISILLESMYNEGLITSDAIPERYRNTTKE